MDSKNFIGIIPARYASTRFPGKPLAMLAGMTVIEHVWRRVSSVLDHVVVATDDERIATAVAAFGGEAVMTNVKHRSGTDRCYEAFLKTGGREQVVINIQGDEPFISPDQLRALMTCFDDAATDIATLVRPFDATSSFEQLSNPNTPKVVVDDDMNACYFSRSVIPYVRGVEPDNWAATHQFYAHIGLYAYRVEALQQITSLPPSSLEMAESLEQLRWLQGGLTIKTAVSHIQTIGIDTPDDLRAAELFLLSQNDRKQ